MYSKKDCISDLSVTIQDEDVENIRLVEGVSQATGKQYSFRQQDCWLNFGLRYPTRISVIIPDKKSPYKAGNYLLAAQSLTADKYGRLKFSPVIGVDSWTSLDAKKSDRKI